MRGIVRQAFRLSQPTESVLNAESEEPLRLPARSRARGPRLAVQRRLPHRWFYERRHGNVFIVVSM